MELYIDLNPKDYFRCSMYYMRKFFGIREIILLILLFVIGMVLFIFADNIFMLILFAVSVGIILLAFVLFLLTAKGGYKVDMEKRGIIKQKLEFTEDAILATSFDKKGNPIFVETHPNEKIDKIAITKKAIYIYAQASVFYYIFADVVPKPFVGRFMALFRVVGTAAGIVFSKWILPLADKQELVPWIFTGVAVIYLISFTQMCFNVKEGQYPPPEKIKKVSLFGMIKKYSVECFSIPFYLYLFIGQAVNTTSNACRVMFNLLYAKEDLGLSMAQYGHITATVSLVMMFAYIPLGWIVDKFHPLRIFILGGFLIIAANIFGFFWCHDYTTFFIVTFMISGTYVLQGASGLPLTVRVYPSEKYGQFCSANAMIGSIVLIVANAGGGAFIDLGKKFGYGYNLIFVWDFIFTIIATTLLLVVYFKWKKYGGDKNYVAPMKDVSI